MLSYVALCDYVTMFFLFWYIILWLPFPFYSVHLFGSMLVSFFLVFVSVKYMLYVLHGPWYADALCYIYNLYEYNYNMTDYMII